MWVFCHTILFFLFWAQYFPDRKVRRLGRPLDGYVMLRIIDVFPFHLWTVRVVENLERRKNRFYLGSGFAAIVNHYRVIRGMVFIFKIRTSDIIDFEICQGFLSTIEYGPPPTPPHAPKFQHHLTPMTSKVLATLLSIELFFFFLTYIVEYL